MRSFIFSTIVLGVLLFGTASRVYAFDTFWKADPAITVSIVAPEQATTVLPGTAVTVTAQGLDSDQFVTDVSAFVTRSDSITYSWSCTNQAGQSVGGFTGAQSWSTTWKAPRGSWHLHAQGHGRR